MFFGTSLNQIGDFWNHLTTCHMKRLLQNVKMGRCNYHRQRTLIWHFQRDFSSPNSILKLKHERNDSNKVSSLQIFNSRKFYNTYQKIVALMISQCSCCLHLTPHNFRVCARRKVPAKRFKICHIMHIVYIKRYGKFWSVSLDLFIEHKPWNWKEWSFTKYLMHILQLYYF